MKRGACVNGAAITPQSVTINGLVTMYAGKGDPGGVLTATQGSFYLRTDGSSSSTRAYINTDGMTTWTAVTTAA